MKRLSKWERDRRDALRLRKRIALRIRRAERETDALLIEILNQHKRGALYSLNRHVVDGLQHARNWLLTAARSA